VSSSVIAGDAFLEGLCSAGVPPLCRAGAEPAVEGNLALDRRRATGTPFAQHIRTTILGEGVRSIGPWRASPDFVRSRARIYKTSAGTVSRKSQAELGHGSVLKRRGKSG